MSDNDEAARGPLLLQLPEVAGPLLAALAPHVAALSELVMPTPATPPRPTGPRAVAQRPTSQDTPELRARLDRLLHNVEQTKAARQKAEAKLAQMRRRLDPDGHAERARVNAEIDRRRERERLQAARARRPAPAKGTQPSPAAPQGPGAADIAKLVAQNEQILDALGSVLSAGQHLFANITERRS